MPHRLEIDWESGIIVIRYDGMIVFGELRSVSFELCALARDGSRLSLIEDFRAAELALSSDEIRGLAEEAVFRQHAERFGKWALLAADTATYGLARMYAAHVQEGDIAVQVFRDVAEAVSWLGRDFDPARVALLRGEG